MKEDNLSAHNDIIMSSGSKNQAHTNKNNVQPSPQNRGGSGWAGAMFSRQAAQKKVPDV